METAKYLLPKRNTQAVWKWQMKRLASKDTEHHREMVLEITSRDVAYSPILNIVVVKVVHIT